jgi:D-alanyl-D-alanine carboxypeptidase
MADERRVPASVLTPVVRRRRRRGRGWALLALAALAAGGGLAVAAHERTGSHAAGAPPAPPPRRVQIVVSRSVPPPAPPPVLLRAARVRVTPPRVTARAAIVVDAANGVVVWSRNPHRRLPIASTTKIMTALLALRRLPDDTLVTVPPAATRVPLIREGLRPRERVRAWKLFDGLLLFSGNDDAAALAIASAGTHDRFVAEMNREARAEGLRDTRFSTPSGVIDEGNWSSAWDLAALTRVALRNARFRAIVRQRIVHVPWSAPTFEKVYVNKNPLLGTYRGADGVKTGWTTRAGHCLVASATRGRRRVIAVVLDDPNAPLDARRLLSLGFRARS